MIIHRMHGDIREAIAELVYYELRAAFDDSTPRELIASAVRVIRASIQRDGSMSSALAHIGRIAMSASLA